MIRKSGLRSAARVAKSRTASLLATSCAPAPGAGQASTGTGQTCSPGTSSAHRLVTTTRASGAPPRTIVVRLATPPATCSAPSRTSKAGSRASAWVTVTAAGTPGWSRIPSAEATLALASAGSPTRSMPRSMATNTTRRAPAGRRRRTSRIRRVFPEPPGPTREVSLLPGSSEVSAAISGSRPTNDENGTGGAPGDVRCAAVSCSRSPKRRRTAGDMPERPFSQRLTVANETPSRAASCSWVSPVRDRSSRTRAAAAVASPSCVRAELIDSCLRCPARNCYSNITGHYLPNPRKSPDFVRGSRRKQAMPRSSVHLHLSLSFLDGICLPA